MKTIFVALNGKPRAGKDSFADAAIAFMKQMGHDGVNYSTITTCIEMAEIAGYTTYYDQTKNMTPDERAMMSELKDWYTKWFDGTFKEMVALIKYSKQRRNDETDTQFNIIFAMIREPSEIEKIQKHCIETGVFFTSVMGYGIRQEAGDSCHSDMNVENYPYHFKYNNSGTMEDLIHVAEKYVLDIIVEYGKWETEQKSISKEAGL